MRFTKLFFSICITFFIVSTSVLSQNNVVDSLENELRNHKIQDTIKVNLLNALANAYCSINLDKALIFIKESEEILNTLHYIKGEAKTRYTRGFILEIQSNHDEAFSYYENALKLYEEINFKEGISDCLLGIGGIKSIQSDYNEAIKYFNKAIVVNEILGDKKGIAKGLNNIGIAYNSLGDNKKAISYFEKALKFFKEANYKQGIANTTNNLGITSYRQGNYSLTLEYFQEGLFINEEFGDELKMAVSLMNIATVYIELGNYDKAIEFNEKALKITVKNEDKKQTATITSNLGIIYRLKRKYQTSIDYLQEALKLSKDIDFKMQIALCLNNLGDVYFSLENYPEALKYFNKAKKYNAESENQLSLTHSYLGLAKVYAYYKKNGMALKNALKSKEISDKFKFLEYQKDVELLLSNIYENTKAYKKALLSHERYKMFSDSVFNKENIEKITQVEYEYKYKRQLDSLSINELKLTKKMLTTSQDLEQSQRNLFLGVIGFLIIALVLCGIIFFLKLRNEKAKTQNIAIEQKLLRSQMTPHFIFNSLSVLQGMILNKEDKKSVFYLSKFSKLLRITLENSRDKLVSLHQELIAIKDYLELQNLEDNQSYDYTILVDKSIDGTLFMIPPMLIQPFIENAIEHAFKGQKENRKIDIQLTFVNKVLICTIVDNGIGIDAQNGHQRKSKKSLATTITSERLKILSKDFNIKGSVQIEDRQKYSEQGTIVTLVIPYKTAIA